MLRSLSFRDLLAGSVLFVALSVVSVLVSGFGFLAGSPWVGFVGFAVAGGAFLCSLILLGLSVRARRGSVSHEGNTLLPLGLTNIARHRLDPLATSRAGRHAA